MTLTLEPVGLLEAGLVDFLTTALGSAVQAGAIITSWPTAALVQQLQAGTLNPLVVVDVGESKLAKVQPGTTSAKTTLGGTTTTNGLTTATQLTEVTRLQTPVTITVLGAGDEAKTLAYRVAALIREKMGLSMVLPLPDSIETASTVPGPLYGLTAQLAYASGLPVHKDAVRQIERYVLTYTATHSDYSVSTVTIATTIGFSLITQAG